MNEIENLKKYFRAVNYLSAIQIYLQDNYLLEEPLKPSHIKPRLLGHWGTCPGINFVNLFLNKIIKQNNADILYVVGPGHGYPAVQSNLFIEGTLKEYYPEATLDEKGIEYITKNFSWPFGFPSHSSPYTPGVILEGGELGYALSTSFGAILDNPDLIVACLIGDGEAETGPTAAAWHINKFINPITDGAVLPILHLNGYKISGPTVFGRMSDEELQKLFEGYGYEVFFVDYDLEKDVFLQMDEVMNSAYQKITELQKTSRSEGKSPVKPKWPMIILKTPKGWTGIDELHGKKITGNHYSHQVPTKDARTKEEDLKKLYEWLKSYNFEELFDSKNGFIQEIKDLIPDGDKRIGKNKNAFGGPDVYKPLLLPDLNSIAEPIIKPGLEVSSTMRRAGEFINEVVSKNPENFRFFSPDETYSNKLDKMFESTSRSFVWPLKEWDEDLSTSGRVMEILSEHTLQGLMQGYVLTGRHGIFASYEAFIQIVSSMADQYAKFLKQSKEVSWRGTIPSFNYILTSSGWRQDHNGFSHQNPGFIDNVLQRQGDFINVYFPVDGNSILAVLDKVMSDTNGINVIVAGKTDEPRWIDLNFARDYVDEGIAIWKFASHENPDIVFAGIGDYTTKEVLAAIDILRNELPDLKMRMINICSLSFSGFGTGGNVLSDKDFQRYFTKEKPVIMNYHGYPQTIKQILFDYCEIPDRFKINGYIENGSTTTPFDMQLRNKTSRYDLVIDACNFLKSNSSFDQQKIDEIIEKYNQKIAEHKIYIKNNGVDPDEIENWVWNS